MRVDLATKAVTPIVTVPAFIGGYCVSGSTVYYTSGTALSSVPAAGGNPTTLLVSGGDRLGEGVVDVAVDANNVYLATVSDVNSIYRIPRAGGPATRMTITSNEILSMVVTANDVVFARDSIGLQSVPKTNDATGAETDLWTPGVRLSYVTTTGKLYVSPNCGLYEVTRN